ncbi:MAG: T9SS type A sorting domain-containing protein [Candidatus Eisenbacteria bacterium]
MNAPFRSIPRPPVRLIRALVSLLFIPLLAMAFVPSKSEGGQDEAYPVDWLRAMEEFYDSHPELKTTKSSGFKPYYRVKWYAESRMDDERAPDGAARRRVWEEKSARVEGAGKAARASWFTVGPANVSGRCLDIEFHPANPDIVYVGSASGGLWKSIDGGDSWAPLTDSLQSLAIGAVAVLPSDPNIVLIGTGEGNGALNTDYGVGILKSVDGGATWGPTSLSYPGTSFTGFNVMEVNPVTGTILAGASGALWRSTDSGETWETVLEGGNYYDVKWKPGDSLRVYAAKGSATGANHVKVSTDDGLTWAKAGVGQPSGALIGKTKIAVTPANPNVIYANYVNRLTSETLGIYRSDDNGENWTAVYTGPNMTGGQGWYNLSLAVDPDDPVRVIAGGVKLYRSIDGGATFDSTGIGYGLGTETSVHWDHHAVAYKPGSNDEVWVCTDGGVWRSLNDGEDWTSRREGLVTYQFYDICVAQSDGAFMMGGTQDNGVPGRVTVDEWFTSTLFADGMVCNVSPGDADEIYGEWQFGNHVKSVNGGDSWFSIQGGIPASSGAWVTPVDQDPENSDHLYTAQNGSIYRTWSGGGSWDAATTGSATWISISPVDGDVVWTVAGTPRLTVDDGGTWAYANSYGFSTGPATKIHAHPVDVASALVTFSGYGPYAHVALTTNYGVTWTDVTGDLPSHPVNTIIVDPTDPNAWYIGTDMGVWWSRDGGAHWEPFETGLPEAVVLDLEIRRGTRKLVAGTYGRGAWEIDLSVPTGVASEPAAASALHLMLDPPSPSPFADQTLLRYAAKSRAPVTLDVFDIRGRRVAHLGDRPSGDGIIRSMYWSAAGVPSGVYFLRLRAGDAETSRRVVIAR